MPKRKSIEDELLAAMREHENLWIRQTAERLAKLPRGSWDFRTFHAVLAEKVAEWNERKARLSGEKG